MVKVSGFTIVRNAIKLDFPVEASIRSILPLCDEVVVNVGRSEDETLDLVRSIGDPRIRILETDWDMTRRNTVLGFESLRAMRECSHPWGVYIQADEVLHERGAAELADAIQRHDADPLVEGLLVHYLHFYGGFDTIATHRRWYRREVRALRLDPALDIRPYQGAQGFRVGPVHSGKSGPGSPPPRCSTTGGPARRRRCGKNGSWARRCTPGATPTSGGRCLTGFRASGASAARIPPPPPTGSRPAGSIPSG